MIIKRKIPSIHIIEGFTFKVGLNTIENDHPALFTQTHEDLIESEDHEVIEGDFAPKKKNDSPSEIVNAVLSSPAKEAVKLIREISDISALEELETKETRKVAVNAIAAQLDVLKNPTKKDENDENN